MSDLVFGKYEIFKRLAVGGMGEIFLAREVAHDDLERLVILKRLLGEDAPAIEAFLDEARVLGSLHHPNVVDVYEVGSWKGAYLIAMEYIHGENFSSLIGWATSMGVKIPIPIVLRLIHDAALGLAFAHQAVDQEGKALEIVHRDVSPQNLMVTIDGVTKLVDFGIALAANRQSATATGLLKGKVGYLAPEQARGTRVDARSDQFALGIVFWELLTGRRLFGRARSPVDALRRLLRGRIRRASKYRRELAPEIEAIAQRMLEFHPSARFPGCHEVAEAIAALLDSMPGGKAEDVGDFVARVVGADLDGATEVDRVVHDTVHPARKFAATRTLFRPELQAGPRVRRLPFFVYAGIGAGALLLTSSLAIHFQSKPGTPGFVRGRYTIEQPSMRLTFEEVRVDEKGAELRLRAQDGSYDCTWPLEPKRAEQLLLECSDGRVRRMSFLPD